jgi:sporulation protein YlmC with PRC-barrel domain
MSKSASTTGAAQSTSDAKFVTSQSSDQWLASKFKGTDVVGTDDKKIGDVSDILFDKDGKIEAFIVSVGGFLGVGSKDVALAPTAFEIVKGKDGSADKLKLAMSKDELKQAQNFEPYKAPVTTGAATHPGGSSGSSTMRPAGAPLAPAK